MAAVSIKEIKSIRPGETGTFRITRPRDIKTIRTLCSRVGGQLRIKYSVSQNKDRTVVVISAAPIEV